VELEALNPSDADLNDVSPGGATPDGS